MLRTRPVRWLALAMLCVACGTPRRAPASNSIAAPAPTPVEFEAAFETLRAALDADETSLAERILAQILARRPTGAAREAADAFGRVIEGRKLAALVHARLESRPGGAPGRGRLFLVIESDSREELTLQSGAATLSSSVFGIDVRGFEHRSATRGARDDLARLRLRRDRPTEIEIADVRVDLSNEMAVRARYELELIQPELLRDGVKLPASALVVEPTEVVLLAPYLPTSEVAPEELERYLARPNFSLAAALERSVRIAPSRRGEALDRIAALASRMNRVDLERVVPCLRWLSGDRELGADPEAWRAEMAERAAAKADGTRPALELSETSLDLRDP